MALWKRTVWVFLSARPGANLFSSVTPICVTGPASIRRVDVGNWQCTFCHLASTFVKQDELKPVIKIKQYELSNLLGFKAAFFFFALLELVNWACIGHVAAVVEILHLMQQSVLPMTLISDTLVCFFFRSHTVCFFFPLACLFQ